MPCYDHRTGRGATGMVHTNSGAGHSLQARTPGTHCRSSSMRDGSMRDGCMRDGCMRDVCMRDGQPAALTGGSGEAAAWQQRRPKRSGDDSVAAVARLGPALELLARSGQRSALRGYRFFQQLRSREALQPEPLGPSSPLGRSARPRSTWTTWSPWRPPLSAR